MKVVLDYIYFIFPYLYHPYKITDDPVYIHTLSDTLTYLLTYLFHGAESFLSS